jgi:hypothetical protein
VVACIDNGRALAEFLAQCLGATRDTVRVTLIFRDGRYVDGYQQRASDRLNPKLLEQLPVDLLERTRGHAPSGS